MILFSQDIFNTRQYFSWSTPFSLDCNKRLFLFFPSFKVRILFLHLGSIVGVCQRLLRGSFTPLCLECEPQPNPSSLLFLFIGDESNQCLVTYWRLRYWSFGDLIGWWRELLLKLVIGKALTIAWDSLEVDNRTFTEDLSCWVTACCGCLCCYS